MTITDVRASDGGIYYCRVGDKQGSVYLEIQSASMYPNGKIVNVI